MTAARRINKRCKLALELKRLKTPALEQVGEAGPP